MELEPFAVQLYRELLAGCDEREIAARTGIPLDRVQVRLRAAREFLTRTQAASSSFGAC